MFYVHVAAVKLARGGGQGEEEGGQGVVCHKVATPQNMTATATVAKAEAEPTMAVKKVSSEKR